MTPEQRFDLAMAAARDAGNRSMHKAGRKDWNRDDYNEAALTFIKLIPEPQEPRDHDTADKH